MQFDVTPEKTPPLVKFPQSTTNEAPSQVDPFCSVLTISDKQNTLSKQGLAFECYVHHLETTKFVRQTAHLTLDLLIFPDHRESKMIRLIPFSVQAGRGTTDPVYHKPDNAKVLTIMDFPFRERVRNFHDSNLLASFPIRKFQIESQKVTVIRGKENSKNFDEISSPFYVNWAISPASHRAEPHAFSFIQVQLRP